MSFSESRQYFTMGFGQVQTIGGNGEDGATFIPSVSPEGELSWTNDKGLENPAPVNIKGQDGKDGQDGYTPVKGKDYFDGKNGQDGQDGYTPVKGKDYFDGTNGKDGKDATSPVISVSNITGGHRITIKDVNGTKTVDVMDGSNGSNGKDGNGIKSAVLNADYTLTLTFDNGTKYTTPSIRGASGASGKDGSNGKDGQDGKTPVKGTDYWTATDKAEMVNDVLAALPTWTGGSY
jgi:hypothetical protein